MHIGFLLLCALLCAAIAAPAMADGAVGALPLDQWPTHRSAKTYLRPRAEQPLVFLGYTRLKDGEGLLVLKSEQENAAILRGADPALFLVPRAPKEDGKAALNDWDAFIADWSKTEAVAGDVVAERTAQSAGDAQIGATGVLLSSANLSPNDYTDLMRQGMDFLAVEDEGIWHPLASIALHAGYVAGGVPEEKVIAPYAAIPATALTPLSARLKNIAYRTEPNIAITRNGQYLVVAVTEGGDLLYSVVKVSNIR